MSRWKSFVFSLLLVSGLPLVVYARSDSSKSTGAAKEDKRAQQDNMQQSAGERKFAQNCGRCHNPPEGFSPHISRTIVRHMRVRASLSKQDEQDILRFLNP